MNLLFRTRQYTLKYASYLIPWPTPEVITGLNAYDELMEVIPKHQTLLIVTDHNLYKLGLLNTLEMKLKAKHINYVIYDKVKPNPSIHCIEEGLKIYHEYKCQGIMAVGGGSPIDCAKVIAARVARPNLKVSKMQGLLKVRRKLVPIYAIPTTAGTGSEVSIAAVVSDEAKDLKYAITDISLTPKYAVLIPELTQSLPASISAATGIDALVHALESYIGKANTKQTRIDAMSAIKLIHANLYNVYLDGNNYEGRANMLVASYYAGKAFTRAYVGNIHAMSHAISALYHTPHGLTNAIVLPYVLKAYGSSIYPQLANISDNLELVPTTYSIEAKTKAVLAWIDELNSKMEIPKHLEVIKLSDLDVLVDKAYHEANPFYPVPVIFTKAEFKRLFIKIKGDN